MITTRPVRGQGGSEVPQFNALNAFDLIQFGNKRGGLFLAAQPDQVGQIQRRALTGGDRGAEANHREVFVENVAEQVGWVAPHFQGGSLAGEDLGRAKDFEEDVVIADVDLRHIRVAREFRPTLRDTRREFWEPVAPGKRAQDRKRRKTR